MSVLNGKAVFGVGQPTAGGGGTTQSVASTSNVATGEWVHVAATRDQLTGTIKVFVNGQENGTLNTGFRNALNGQEHIRLGGSTENETSYFDGQIDEVRIFDEVLTAEQIQANYNQGLSGFESNLVSYYDFNNVICNHVYDLSSSNNTGTLFGDRPKVNVYVQFDDYNVDRARTVSSWKRHLAGETPDFSFALDGDLDLRYTGGRDASQSEIQATFDPITNDPSPALAPPIPLH